MRDGMIADGTPRTFDTCNGAADEADRAEHELRAAIRGKLFLTDMAAFERLSERALELRVIADRTLESAVVGLEAGSR